MKDSRLHCLLETFDKRDWREMRKLVQSPFFNQRQDVTQLFEFLWECFEVKKEIPTKATISKIVYPKAKFDIQQIRLIMTFLHKKIEQYFVLCELDENELESKTKLLQAYNKRKLKKHFDKSLRETQHFLEKRNLRNADFFDCQFKILREEQIFNSQEKRFGEQNLQGISDNLDWSFLAMKLKQSCIALSQQAVMKIEYDAGLLTEVLRFIETRNLQTKPAIGIYYYLWFALTDLEDETHFSKLKRMLFEHSDKFPKEEIRGLYQLAINYCIRKLNDGKVEFANEGLDFYKMGLQSEILLEEGILSRFAYRNIVAMGLKSGDLDWVERFVFDYKKSLEKAHQEAFFSFNLAKVEYERKHLGRVLELLQKADYKDLLLNLAAKTLAMKTYYELSEFNLLESHLESMRTFIRRKKIFGYHLNNYLNVVNYTKKLMNLNFYDKKAIRNFQELIEKEEVLTEKEWLLSQLNV